MSLGLTDCTPLIIITYQLQLVSANIDLWPDVVKADSNPDPCSVCVMKGGGRINSNMTNLDFILAWIPASFTVCVLQILCLGNVSYNVSVCCEGDCPVKRSTKIPRVSRTSVCRRRPTVLQCRLREASKSRWNMQEGEFITNSVTSCLSLIHHHSLVNILQIPQEDWRAARRVIISFFFCCFFFALSGLEVTAVYSCEAAGVCIRLSIDVGDLSSGQRGGARNLVYQQSNDNCSTDTRGQQLTWINHIDLGFISPG